MREVGKDEHGKEHKDKSNSQPRLEPGALDALFTLIHRYTVEQEDNGGRKDDETTKEYSSKLL